MNFCPSVNCRAIFLLVVVRDNPHMGPLVRCLVGPSPIERANIAFLRRTLWFPLELFRISPFVLEHIECRGYDGTWSQGSNAALVDFRNAVKRKKGVKL